MQVYKLSVSLCLSEGEVALSEGHPSITQRSCVALSLWWESEERTESGQISGLSIWTFDRTSALFQNNLIMPLSKTLYF